MNFRRPARWKFQFSLAKLLVSVAALAGVFFAVRVFLQDRTLSYRATKDLINEVILCKEDGTELDDPSQSVHTAFLIFLEEPELKKYLSDASKISSVRELDLGGSEIATTSFAQTNQMKSVTNLSLAGCEFLDSGVCIQVVKNFPALQHLDLSRSNCDHQCLQFLVQIANLETLNLSSTNMTIEQIVEALQVTGFDLHELSVRNLGISDNAFLLGSLSIHHIDLGHNDLTYSELRRLLNATKAKQITVLSLNLSREQLDMLSREFPNVKLVCEGKM